VARFKVGDLIREKKRDLGKFTYCITDNRSICEVLEDIGPRNEVYVKIIKCWNNERIGHTYWVNPDRMELIETIPYTEPQECPTIIKVSQTFTLQIKDITIELDQHEINELKKQLGEV
tara:strand:- start:407 stop:760 length:354 start_codon:yes stop_codon:yes gene_type:complete